LWEDDIDSVAEGEKGVGEHRDARKKRGLNDCFEVTEVVVYVCEVVVDDRARDGSPADKGRLGVWEEQGGFGDFL
jgi:hypothetical protein